MSNVHGPNQHLHLMHQNTDNIMLDQTAKLRCPLLPSLWAAKLRHTSLARARDRGKRSRKDGMAMVQVFPLPESVHHLPMVGVEPEHVAVTVGPVERSEQNLGFLTAQAMTVVLNGNLATRTLRDATV